MSDRALARYAELFPESAEEALGARIDAFLRERGKDQR